MAVTDRSAPAWHWWQRWGMSILGIVVLLLTGTTAAVSIHQSGETQRLAQCLQAYADSTADAIDARAAASNAATTALDDLISAFVKLTPDQAGRDRAKALLDDYVAKRRVARQAQVDHPYPPAPRDLC
jgi:hypothetical protein